MTPSDPAPRATPIQPSGAPALEPTRLHPASPVLGTIAYLRQGVVPLVVLLVSVGWWAFPVAAVIGLLVMGWRFLAWSRYTYRIEGGMLRIDEGVLRRDVREIPLTRIQQVDLRRQLRHRVFGVVAVRVDTAGGGSGAEAVLDALSEADAMALRSVLLAHQPLDARQAHQPTPTLPPPAGPPSGDRPNGPPPFPATDGPPPHVHAPPPPAYGAPPGTMPPPAGPPPHAATPATAQAVAGETVIRLGTRDLIVAGLTGSGLLAGLSVVGVAFWLLEVLPSDTTEDVPSEVIDVLGGAVLASIAAVVVVVPVWLVLAAGTSILRDHDFTLVRYGGDLHVRRGLLDEREATLALHRVQAVWVIDNPLRRRLGLAMVQLQSAGSGTDAASDVTRVTIPLVSAGDLPRVLGLVLPGEAAVPTLIPAPPAALRRARVRALVPATVVALVPFALTRHPAALAALLILVPAALYAQRAYRALGHARTATTVVGRSGAIVRHTAVVPVAKTQSCRLRSSPFQRRVHLATLTVQVAGRGPTVAIIDGDADRLQGLRTDVLVAPGARLDEVAVRRRTQAGLEAEPQSDRQPEPVPAGGRP